MKYFHILCILLFVNLYANSYAQYSDFYRVEENTNIITTDDALLYELPSSLTYNISTNRELIDISNYKTKRLKKPKQLKVVRYTNIHRQQDYDAYIVEYKDKLWVLENCYAQEDTLLKQRNSRIVEYKQELEGNYIYLQSELENKKNSLDHIISVHTKECTDSLNYYKHLLSTLPQKRDSLVEIARAIAKAEEQSRIDSIYKEWYDAQPSSTKRAADIIQITNLILYRPNYVGGCDFSFEYINESSKTIKYLNWSGETYNAVNDPVSCEIRRTSLFRGQDTGPVEPGGYGGGTWDCIIYNSSARTLILDNIRITYMDGTSANIGVADIRRLLNEPSKKVSDYIQIDINEVTKHVMSDMKCQSYINIWEQRLSNLNKKQFFKGHYENLYMDNSYMEIWKKLKEYETSIKETQDQVALVMSQKDTFDKYINFALTYSTASNEYNSYSSRTNDQSISSTNINRDPFVSIGLEASVERLNSISFGTGVTMKVGRYNSPINVTIGAKHIYSTYSSFVSYSFKEDNNNGYSNNYFSGYADYNQNVSQIAFPLIFNCNVTMSNNSVGYLGIGIEKGVLLSNNTTYTNQYNFNEDDLFRSDEYIELVQICAPSKALILQLGAAGRHYDWKIYCKLNINYNDFYHGEQYYFGTALSYYF